MISYVRGELAEINMDHVVIDVGGIGYAVYMPLRSMEELPYIGEVVKLHTYLQVREDAFVLFGFSKKDDLDMFRQLINVNGIGPKGGLAILSTLSADDIRFAILSGDAKTIAKAPGIGAKIAQRLILELKDKVSLEEAFEQKFENSGKAASPAAPSVKNDAVMALNALGYSSSESLKAVSKVAITEGMTVEDVLRLALKHLSFL